MNELIAPINDLLPIAPCQCIKAPCNCSQQTGTAGYPEPAIANPADMPLNAVPIQPTQEKNKLSDVLDAKIVLLAIGVVVIIAILKK